MSDPKAPEDTQFTHYSLQHRVIAWISLHLFDHTVYTVHHGLLKGMKRKGGLGWMPGHPRRHDPGTEILVRPQSLPA